MKFAILAMVFGIAGSWWFIAALMTHVERLDARLKQVESTLADLMLDEDDED